MNREIKFRAFSTAVNKMAEVLEINFKQNAAYVITPIGSMRKDESVLMQYTGLKDSKENEVYEGDIIKSPLGNVVQVKFGTKTYRTKLLPIPGDDIIQLHGWIVENKRGLTEVLDETFLSGEVVGNIYEHAWILEGQAATGPQ